jgi:PKD repeat protein
VRLTITDTCGYTDTVTSTVVVTPDCTPLTSVNFTVAPEALLVNAPVTFTATIVPAMATAPLTYTWTFGDGATATSNSATAAHTYASAGSKAVRVTVHNPCTLPDGVQHQRSVVIEPRRVFLPLTVRSR